MLHSWSLQNYSRCYQDYQWQTFNTERTINIHQFFTNSKSNLRDYNVNTELWSTTFSKDQIISIQFELHVHQDQKKGSIQITLIVHDKQNYVLENICFNDIFQDETFKISFKLQTIGIRYKNVNGEKNIFQILFHDEFECRMAVDCMYRFGLLTRQWSGFNYFDVTMTEIPSALPFTKKIEDSYFSPPPTQKRIIIDELEAIKQQQEEMNMKEIKQIPEETEMGNYPFNYENSISNNSTNQNSFNFIDSNSRNHQWDLNPFSDEIKSQDESTHETNQTQQLNIENQTSLIVPKDGFYSNYNPSSITILPSSSLSDSNSNASFIFGNEEFNVDDLIPESFKEFEY